MSLLTLLLSFLLSFHPSTSRSNNRLTERCNFWLTDFIRNSPHSDCYCYQSCLPRQTLASGDGEALGLGPAPDRPRRDPGKGLATDPSSNETKTERIEQIPGMPKTEFISYRCGCDPWCQLYGDCCTSSALLCPDDTSAPQNINLATQQDLPRPATKMHRLECVNPTEKLNKYNTAEGFYMVTMCASDWFESDMIQACAVEQQNVTGNFSNLIEMTPVTAGNVTYRNAYCAYCNHHTNTSEYIYWTSQLVCNKTIISMVILDLSNNSLQTISEYCFIHKFQFPFLQRNDDETAANLASAARPCMKVETECLPYGKFYSLTNMSTSEYECLQLSCRGHTEYIRAKNRYFKNRFCAVCNGFSLSEVQCTVPVDPVDDNRGNIANVGRSDFVMLMAFTSSGQFTFSSGKRHVTISHDCPINQVYDPHIQQCRQLACIGQTTCDKTSNAVAIAHITFNLFLSANVTDAVLNNSFHDDHFVDEFKALLYDRLKSSLNKSIISLYVSVKPNSRVFVTATVQQPTLNASLTLNLGSFSLHGMMFIHMQLETKSELHFDCLLITLNATEFNQLNNGTVVETASGIVLNRNEYILLSDGRLRRCSNYSSNYTTTETHFVWDYKEFVIILSTIGSCLNIVSCSVVLLTYACFKSLRTLPGLNLMNLVTAILVSHLILITGAGQVNDTQVCTAVAFLLHLFFLGSFTWSSVAAFDILRTFVLDKGKSHLTTVSIKQTIFRYCAYGWGMPLLISSTCLLLDKVSAVHIGYGSKSACWINNRNALTVVFIAPVCLIILFNFVVFIVSARSVYLGLKHSAELHGLRGRSQKERKRSIISLRPQVAKTLKKEVIALFSIFSLLSLTWIFALMAASEKTSFFWYPFMVFTSLQGVFLLISYVLKKQVRLEYKKVFNKIMTQMNQEERPSTNDDCETKSSRL